MSLLNKVLRVPRVPDSLSARLSKCLSSVWVPKCPSALSARVPKWISSARVPKVAWLLECPSALGVPKCFSKSISHSAIQSAGLQCWFSKLISTLSAHSLMENLILRQRKRDLISNSSLIKWKSLKELRNICYHFPSNVFSRV